MSDPIYTNVLTKDGDPLTLDEFCKATLESIGTLAAVIDRIIYSGEDGHVLSLVGDAYESKGNLT